MSKAIPPIIQLLQNDRRYKLEAYQFVREALAYAQEVMKMGERDEGERGEGECGEGECGQGNPDPLEDEFEVPPERHISGQQLCQAIRAFAQDQFGLMAQVVLNSWGLYSTGDFGEIVYNLIEIDCMKKSDADRREDFNDQFKFDQAFRDYEIKRLD